MIDRTSEIYNCEPDIENVNPIYLNGNNNNNNNNDRIKSIENSIKASLLNSNVEKKYDYNFNTTLKLLMTATSVGIFILLGIVIYLMVSKH